MNIFSCGWMWELELLKTEWAKDEVFNLELTLLICKLPTDLFHVTDVQQFILIILCLYKAIKSKHKSISALSFHVNPTQTNYSKQKTKIRFSYLVL